MEGEPRVTVERIVPPDAPDIVREEGIDIEEVADSSGEENEPDMLLRLVNGVSHDSEYDCGLYT